jgi:hypothetical protein
MDKKCQHPDDCPNIEQLRRGLCQMHYARWKTTGELGPVASTRHEKGSVKCSDDHCDEAAVSKGMCDRHYRAQRRGTATGRPRGPMLPWRDRFLAKVDRRSDDECWPWLGCINKQTGYGEFGLDGRVVAAHRLAYEIGNGEIPVGLTIDHVKANGCTRRDCQNWVRHLEAVTHWENNRRGDSAAAQAARAEECPNGHEYTPETTLTMDGQRRCKICWDAKQARRAARKRERRRQQAA